MNDRVRHGLRLLVVALLLVPAASGCDGSDGSGEPGSRSASGSGDAYRVDMDAIFPPHPGRDILLNNCQSCHTWVPVVVLQMNETEWARSSNEHRDRVEALSDEEFEILYDYLSSTFTPDRPVPELPAPLLESWTTY